MLVGIVTVEFWPIQGLAWHLKMVIFLSLIPPGTTEPSLPYVIVGDEAFPLKNYMMRPYPGRQLDGNLMI